MELLSQVIEQLKEKFQPKPEVEPVLPDFINPEDSLIVIRIKGGYKVESLQERKSYVVSKVDSKVYCSCEHGQEEKHCTHKIAVWKEALMMKKMRIDECEKRRIAAGLSSYIRTLKKILAACEQRGDTQSCTYWFHKGKLLSCKHILRTVIEA